ncbi:MAG: ABC transporter permease subunit [Halomonadaceae bacterium]|nr:MAG: ABC transporter permease subunit [Halomonadaceae bacterium]
MSVTSSTSSGANQRRTDLLPSREQRMKLRRKRAIKDGISRYGIGAAGIGVVAALALIFVYLFSEVVPMFKSATMEPEFSYPLPAVSVGDDLVHLAMERYEELGAVFTLSGQVSFFEVDGGALRRVMTIPRPEGAATTASGIGEGRSGLVAYGYDNGQASLVRHTYSNSFPTGTQRVIEPNLEFPLGESPLTIDEQGRALSVINAQKRGDDVYIGAATEDGEVLLATFRSRTNMMTGETTLDKNVYTLEGFDGKPQHILLNDRFRHLYVADDKGYIHHYNIINLNRIELVESIQVTDNGRVTAMDFLVGTVSVITGTSDGQVAQWFPVRDDFNQYSLKRIRDFQGYAGAITDISPENFRKGFWVADDTGMVGGHYATAANNLVRRQLSDLPINQISISPRYERMLSVDQSGEMQVTEIWNRHPETSFSSLWQKVWYEGRSSPDYVWQSSSGSDEFEPKMSFVPLSIGTLKAAFYAMLFAMPLAIMGAIYTAYFMTPKLRGLVKPSIEIMEALPTVILGFLAGLWLAPFVEGHLPAVFSILILMPLSMLGFGLAWSQVPQSWRNAIPTGWEAVLLVPVIILVGYICVTLSPNVEVWFFDGSMRQWFTDQGITYDQRNALIVGVAMGFAVIPTIFSIAEDAVFNVPRHLTQGSLALGATSWQTMVGVVLPTASPGIFSGVMMGFGRAIGETMIVLMATGNSPITNFNIFEGMRTLSANIAVELPETAVGSTHFRTLFLAALVLFVLTFVLNTIAEVVRQRLRKRYSSL